MVLVLVLAVIAAGCGSGGPATRTQPPKPPPLAVYADGVRLAVLRPGHSRFRIPARLDVHARLARVTVVIPRGPARRAVRHALAAHVRRVDVAVQPVQSAIAIRPVRQLLHNNCEATALSMLLTARGIHVGQLTLQNRLPLSGPLDPEPVAGSTLFRWGDPEKGFVGRAAGGGTEGGFGVYEPPIRALAARYGVQLVDLHGRSLAALRNVVLAGNPVLAWVGLADGPFLSWLTPEGREITVNLDEHAVTLVGAGPGYILVDNPLSGLRERWSDSLFSYRWNLLGHRALELPLQR